MSFLKLLKGGKDVVPMECLPDAVLFLAPVGEGGASENSQLECV